MTELSDLPPAERAKRYRELEEQALREAQKASGEHAEAFLRLAKAWADLAEVAGRMIVQNAALQPENEIEQKQAALRAPPKADDPTEPES